MSAQEFRNAASVIRAAPGTCGEVVVFYHPDDEEEFEAEYAEDVRRAGLRAVPFDQCDPGGVMVGPLWPDDDVSG